MGATIYFADEAGVRSDYHAGTTWAPVGRTPVVAATGDRFGVNLISAVTGLALAATAYSRALGQRLMQAGDAPVEGGTTPSEATPEDLAGVQRQLTVLQWLIPGLTGAALVLNALMGEQQRPQQVTGGLLAGLRSRLPVLALAGTGLWVRARSRRRSTS